MIASDDANPAFMGAHDPDSKLFVRFYKKTLPNNFETQKQGHPIFYECDFVEIRLPGDKLNSVDEFVNESHKQRFPKHWQHYLNNNKEGELIIGTPVTEWPIVTRAIAEELKYLGFKTVESIATASDSQLDKLGMKGGMQPHTFRERAQRYLATASQEASANAESERAAAAEARATAAEDAIAEMRAQMAALQQAQPEKGKPGRKPKQAETV